ncbi:TetR/AcrR family transcriptional regulator C-terminal domain-containing protein [Gordonia sp. PP30]|uniref:TetR/AcrR family transcriptional regulator C-terminal domain-containing protein n=1 Tax=Gordonia sp. PP30 TaxID=2935861 RepID=UPI001FFEE304|nr:TetR/AcrR family transcriptional regulator C-terminal domain-containing protein [Gordonia sp. PP30]UQE76641.1 TetR/AcrR family transcriptional regulator C-terminal domain-containing protein [Gordonia sp. PP30]
MAAKLSRDRIIDEAFALLDDAGIDGLTVRALAGRLGVKAPALYWHVASKQDLLDQMGTEVARRVERRFADTTSGDSFAGALRGYAMILREEYLAHRDGARTFSGTRLMDPGVLRGREAALEHWTRRGLTLERIVDVVDIVTAFVVGFVIEEQERQDQARYSLRDRDEAVGDDYPLTVRAGHHGFRPSGQRFDDQLTLLLAGVAPE